MRCVGCPVSPDCRPVAPDQGACQSRRASHLSHAVAAGENLSINDHEGPVYQIIGAGKYKLNQMVHFLASHPRCILPCKAASVEFAPDPALDPLWISYWEPFHGAAKKDFGFQVTMKVAQEAVADSELKMPQEVPPTPKQIDSTLPLQPEKLGIDLSRSRPEKGK